MRFRRVSERITQLDIRPLFRLAAHAEPAFHVLLVERGTLVQRVGRRSFDLSAGSVRISAPGEEQCATYGEHGARCLSIHLDPDACPAGFRGVEVRADEKWRRWARRIIRVAGGGPPLDLEEIERSLARLQAFRSARDAGHRPAWVSQVRDQLAEESGRPPRLAEIATRVDRSRAQVARGFKNAFGCTIGQFIRQQRAEKAVVLIQRGVPLAEAALAAGFVDQAHMHRTVYAHTGRTPAAWRPPRPATPLQDE